MGAVGYDLLVLFGGVVRVALAITITNLLADVTVRTLDPRLRSHLSRSSVVHGRLGASRREWKRPAPLLALWAALRFHTASRSLRHPTSPSGFQTHRLLRATYHLLQVSKTRESFSGRGR